MGKVSYIGLASKDDYVGLETVSSLSSIEEVATLMEVHANASSRVDASKTVEILRDNEGYLYLVLDFDVVDGSFDLYGEINRLYDSEVEVNCVNALLLFPIEKSRGVYEDTSEPSTDSYDDDQPTSYMDETDVGVDTGTGKLRLYYKKANLTISVNDEDFIIGRSLKSAGFLIKGNLNISREHCNVYYEDGNLYVHDMESGNGTFVNGVRVQPSNDVQLGKGDTLSLADEDFTIV